MWFSVTYSHTDLSLNDFMFYMKYFWFWYYLKTVSVQVRRLWYYLLLLTSFIENFMYNTQCKLFNCNFKNMIKGPFHDPQSDPFIFLKKRLFLSAGAFRYIMFVCKFICLTKKSVKLFLNLLCRDDNYQHSGLYATVWYSKTCVTHKHNPPRIDWKFKWK